MKSCLNCKLQFICVSFAELQKVLNSAEYQAIFDDSKIIPGVHGQCYQATASDCGFYVDDIEIDIDDSDTEIIKIIAVLDEAFKYSSHNCRLTFEQRVQLADAHEKLRSLKVKQKEESQLSNAEQYLCPKCEKPRGKDKLGAYETPCLYCDDLCPF